jgi:hypothetical protein
MKRLSLIFLFTLTGLIILPGQNAVSVSVIKAIRENKPSEIRQYFNKVTDLDLGKYRGTYNKDQAGKITEDYLKTIRIESVTVKRQDKTDDGGAYTLGTLLTDKGEFTLYFVLKPVDKDWLIHQFRIQKQ